MIELFDEGYTYVTEANASAVTVVVTETMIQGGDHSSISTLVTRCHRSLMRLRNQLW